jgi:hypothetical protein
VYNHYKYLDWSKSSRRNMEAMAACSLRSVIMPISMSILVSSSHDSDVYYDSFHSPCIDFIVLSICKQFRDKYCAARLNEVVKVDSVEPRTN